MPNEPLPWQLTVGKLRAVLDSAQDNAVVVLRLPAGFKSHSELVTFLNLNVKDSGSIMMLSPLLHEPGET